MRIKAAPIIIIGFIVAIFSSFIAIADNETPHNASKTVSCGNCHGEALTGGLISPFWGGSYEPANIDDTLYNKICLECHTKASGPYTSTEAPLVRTHSSLATDAGYGNWTRECRDCHNPHYQKQSIYGYREASNINLARGTITSCGAYNSVNNTTTLTYSGITYKTGWEAAKLLEKTGSYRRAILYPNEQATGYNYPVKAIDTTTITVEGNATAAYQWSPPPTTFTVMYGQYIKDIIDIKADPSVSPPPASIYKTVKFLDKTGAKSFADGDTTYNGVCEVCHTKTTHFRNNDPITGLGSDQLHSNVGGAAGTNCTACHTHLEGFKASCNACHGYPPIVDAATSPNGLVWILPVTGSVTAGAHNRHVNTKNYQCDVCHHNNIVESGKHNANPRYITLGFYMFTGTYQGGSYDGQSLNPAGYNTTTTTPATSVTKTGSKTCSNLYCHGGTMAPNGGTAQAIWDVQASAACGTCHGASTGAPPQRGSHPKHAGSASGGRQLECTICHYNYTSNHVNGSVDWAYDTATYTWLSGALYKSSESGSATPVPSTSYGTCTNLYCHSQGTSNTAPFTPNIAALWGGALDATCSGCHSGDKNATNNMATGSHTKHVVSSSMDCTKCHTQTASDSRTISNQANHVNNLVNVAYDTFSNPGGNATYNGSTSPVAKTPGTAYGNCTNSYCHGSGTPTWGGAAIACDGCHKASKILQGKHGVHYASATVAINRNAANSSSGTTYAFNCGVCHDPGATTHAGGPVSGMQAAQVVFDATYAGGGTYTAGTLEGTDNGFNWTTGAANNACLNTYCHSPGTITIAPYPAPNVTSFQWIISSTLTCSGCHGNTTYTTDYRKGAPLYASGTPKQNAHRPHTDARATAGSDATECSDCHNTTTTTNTTITNAANHVNKVYNVSGGTATYANGDDVSTYVTVSMDYASGACSNVSCHPTGLGGTKPSIPWNDKDATNYQCTDCHNINLTGNIAYHHSLNSDTYTPNPTTESDYPTTVPQGNWSSGTNPISRKCLMCHVKHNIFSNRMNTNAALTSPRAMNLRSDIGTAPTASSGYANTDYSGSTPYGICISCHNAELTKDTGRQVNETNSTKTPVISNTSYSGSAHQYNIDTTMKTGGSTFSANCSKCHNVKNGEGSTTFQNAGAGSSFGTHDSIDRRLLATLGITSPSEPFEENFCYRCHSSTTDINPGEGPAKTTAYKDYYGVSSMQLKPTITNTLYLGETTSIAAAPGESASTDTFQGGTWQACKMLPTQQTSWWTQGIHIPDTGTLYWRMTSFVSPAVASTTSIPTGTWTLKITSYEDVDPVNARIRATIYVWTAADTKGTVILAPTSYSSELTTTATTYNWDLAGGAATLNPGDRIVVEFEIDSRRTTLPSGTKMAHYEWGYDSKVVMPTEVPFIPAESLTETLYFGETTSIDPVPSASGSTDTFQGGTWQAWKMMPTQQIGSWSQSVTVADIGDYYWRMASFVSPAVASATTMPAGTWTLRLAAVEGGLGVNGYMRATIYVWTASDTKGTEIVPPISYPSELTTTTTTYDWNVTGIAATLNPGDRIVVEFEIDSRRTAAGSNYAYYLWGGGASVTMPNELPIMIAYSRTTPPDPAPSEGIFDAMHGVTQGSITNTLFLRETTPYYYSDPPPPHDSASTDFFQQGNWGSKELMYAKGTASSGDIGTAAYVLFPMGQTTGPSFWQMVSFVSLQVATTTSIPAGTWTLKLAASEERSDDNAYMRATIYVWTSENAKGTEILSPISYDSELYAGLWPAIYDWDVSGRAATLNPGDRIIVELEIETKGLTCPTFTACGAAYHFYADSGQ